MTMHLFAKRANASATSSFIGVDRRPSAVKAFAFALLGAAAICAGTRSHAAEDTALLDALSARFSKTPVVISEFTQTRTLSALTRPVKSSGRLVYARDRGVIWQIDKPYRATYVIDDEQIVEIDANNNRRAKSTKEAPAVGEVGRVFRSIVSGDRKTLIQYFGVTASGDASKWELRLTPKDKVAPFLKSVTVRGGRFIDHIGLTEPSGDRTDLAFERQRADSALDDADARLFAPK
ncbi:MAG: outer rane lipoprotein carrier protein LolA [Betaproteobacteria bacterium]|nr:outer rane lipoprotein carrier protein LolA [Betaproteobacteria bacterium]